MHFIAEETEGDVGDEDGGEDEDEREYLVCLVSNIQTQKRREEQ
jgi:hypothetical protein